MKIEIDKILPWSDGKNVQTGQGARILRTAEPTQDFWGLWRSNKAALKEAGVSVGKDRKTGAWQVCHWGRPDDSADRKAFELSHALDGNLPANLWPSGLEPFGFQKGGVQYHLERRNSSGAKTLIADEMGLGKTIQAIVIGNAIKARSVLVVCPASLKANWVREWLKWTTQPQDAAWVKNGKDTGCAFGHDVVVINYELLGQNRERIAGRGWDLVVFDEAHYLKNTKAQRTRACLGYKDKNTKEVVKGVADLADDVLFLTGTPILNRPIEIQPIVAKCNSPKFGNFFRFGKRYCDAHHNGWGWDFTGASNLDELQRELRGGCMVRRLKKDVLTQLPPKTRSVITLPPPRSIKRYLDEESRQWKLAKETVRDTLQSEASEATSEDAEFRAAIKKLTTAGGHAFDEYSAARKEMAIAKAPLVVEHVADVLEGSEDKVIVFGHTLDAIDEIIDGLKRLGHDVVNIDGRTPQNDRQRIVDRFQEEEGVRVFVGGITAAGVGLTLTAASTVIFSEQDWRPGMNVQAEDRAHRIGQADNVLVHYLVFEDSVDAEIARSQVSKADVIDDALDLGAADFYDEADEQPASIEAAEPDTSEPEWVKARREREAARAERDGAWAKKREARNARFLKLAGQATDHQVSVAFRCLREVAGMDADRAQKRNDVGFSKVDGKAGHFLAGLDPDYGEIDPVQKGAALALAWKYRRQTSTALTDQIAEICAAKK